jgi:hypothetical protein
MWYSEKDFGSIDVDRRSLVIASANLTQKFDRTIDPVDFYATLTQDDTDIDWWNVAEYTDGIDIGRVVEDGSWPDSSLAIVKFRRLDEKAAGLVDHYCLVADHRAHSIVDSLDARIKSAVEYGEVLGWASYVKEAGVEELDQIIADAEVKESPGLSADKTSYLLDKDETLWDVARKLSIPVNTLIEFNSIGDPRYIKEGFTLRLPQTSRRETPDAMYELLDTPRQMHVSHDKGTTKFSFGNATKWKDIKPTTRRYAHKHPVTITAIAHVSLSDEVESAKYYMEAVDVGNDATNDRVRYTVGFSHSHLSEGIYIEPEPEPELNPEPEPEPIKAPEPVTIYTADWKNTQVPLNAEKKPMLYMANETILVHDLDHKRPPKTLRESSGVMIYSTFDVDGVVYARPLQCAKSGTWYGIPMDKLLSEEEVYNINVSLADRVALRGRLTAQEKGVVYLSRFLSQGTKIKTIFTKHK